MWGKLLSLVLLVLVIFLSLYDAATLYIRVIFENDFLAHLTAFLILTVAVRMAWDRSRLTAVALCLFAIGIEAAQILTPDREPSLLDVAGNLAGIGLGILVARVLRRPHRQPSD